MLEETVSPQPPGVKRMRALLRTVQSVAPQPPTACVPEGFSSPTEPSPAPLMVS